jgi:hypothetical protein
MSFGKLLAAGKSIVNGRGAIAYRQDKRFSLPKFGEPKNPFTLPPKNEAAQSPSENSGATAKKVPTPILAKTQKMPAVSATARFSTTWTSKLNPMTILRGSQSVAKNVPLPVVQAELSLDSVKVVHNDLTDAEVEIVPIKSRRSSSADLPLAKNTWEALGERLLKATTL